MVTVKVQEDINKQRTLEALEREMAYHLLTVNAITSAYKEASTDKDITYHTTLDNVLSERLDTRVWENSEISRYLLELDPKTAATVETYYTVMVIPINRQLEFNQQEYKKLTAPCSMFYGMLTGEKRMDREICDTIYRNAVMLQAEIGSIILEQADNNHKMFHPTRDRLNSLWLKMILGDKTVEILR